MAKALQLPIPADAEGKQAIQLILAWALAQLEQRKSDILLINSELSKLPAASIARAGLCVAVALSFAIHEKEDMNLPRFVQHINAQVAAFEAKGP